MEKLAGDLLLGLKFVRLEILSTFIDFLYEELGELRSRSSRVKGLFWAEEQNSEGLNKNVIPNEVREYFKLNWQRLLNKEINK